MSKPKFDVYQAVTDKILTALDRDIMPWRKPWAVKGNGFGSLHCNLTSKKPYRGINQFLLEVTAVLEGYDSPYWMSFKQAKERGGTVRKGEKSTLITFWKRIQIEDEVDGEKIKKTIPLLRHFNVFNIEQIDGIEIPVIEDENAPTFEPIEEAQRIAEDMPNAPRLRHYGDRAYYGPQVDGVTLPKPENFDTPEDYYSTRFHELAHSTGHESRLNREGAFGNEFGSEKYAKEELVAEMAAAMVCAMAQIDPDVSNTTAYVRNWMTKADYEAAFKNDKKLIVNAAAKAQRAADCILGFTYENGEQS